MATKLIAIVDNEILHDVYDRLILEEKLGQCKLAFLHSCEDKDSGKWIGSLHGIEGGIAFMSNGEFRNILRDRLLLPQLDINGAMLVAKCPCCYNQFTHSQEGLVVGPSHALGCRVEQALFTARHNKVRDLLAEYLKKILTTHWCRGHCRSYSNSVARAKC